MVTIVDYQMGNLRSVQNALLKVGAETEITGDPDRIRTADKLVLPGVGAFAKAMEELSGRHLIDPLRHYLETGRPFLGICLGMQLLFESSSEGGRHPGLGIFKGSVERLDVPHPFKVPHIGWNRVRPVRASPLLYGVPPGAYFYFVHSYYVVPQDGAIEVLQTEHGRPFCSMVSCDHIAATQFHPEKSQAAGLQLLENFVRR